jgi:hypothetical protein
MSNGLSTKCGFDTLSQDEAEFLEAFHKASPAQKRECRKQLLKSRIITGGKALESSPSDPANAA